MIVIPYAKDHLNIAFAARLRMQEHIAWAKREFARVANELPHLSFEEQRKLVARRRLEDGIDDFTALRKDHAAIAEREKQNMREHIAWMKAEFQKVASEQPGLSPQEQRRVVAQRRLKLMSEIQPDRKSSLAEDASAELKTWAMVVAKAGMHVHKLPTMTRLSRELYQRKTLEQDTWNGFTGYTDNATPNDHFPS